MVVRKSFDGPGRLLPRWATATSIGIAVVLTAPATPAGAAVFGNYDGGDAYFFRSQPASIGERDLVRPHRPKRPHAQKLKDGPNTLAGKAHGVLQVVVSLQQQRLHLFADGVEVAQSRVSTGMPGHSTPTGLFSVIQKQRWHESNIYSGAPMPFMQRITWSGIALHLGVVPGHPASHGCIRMPDGFAQEMWGTTRLGARVIVTPAEATPVDFAHPRLFSLRHAPDPMAAPGAKPDPAPAATHQGASELHDPLATDTVKAQPVQLAAADPPAQVPAAQTDKGSSPVAPAVAPVPAAAPAPAAAPTLAVAPAPPLKPGPISVFISRKESKLFVRKGFDPVFSAPITIERPGEPLGTHLFTALDLKEDGTTFRWNLVSLGSRPPEQRSRKARKAPEPVVASGPDAAAAALQRVTIPDDVVQRISELMSPGASLIISDAGLGPETGEGTDFIVLTR